MIEVVCNDRLGKKVRVKCNMDDTIGDLKKLIAAQTGTRAEKIRLQKWYNIYKDHITLEVHAPTASYAFSGVFLYRTSVQSTATWQDTAKENVGNEVGCTRPAGGVRLY